MGLLRRESPGLSDEGSKDDHLVVVVVRGGWWDGGLDQGFQKVLEQPCQGSLHGHTERGRMLPPPHCNVVPPSQLELKISRLTLWSNQIEFTLKLFFKLVFSAFLRAWLNPSERQLMDLSNLKSLAVFDLIKWRISSMSSFPAIFLSNPALIVYTVRNLHHYIIFFLYK